MTFERIYKMIKILFYAMEAYSCCGECYDLHEYSPVCKLFSTMPFDFTTID